MSDQPGMTPNKVFIKSLLFGTAIGIPLAILYVKFGQHLTFGGTVWSGAAIGAVIGLLAVIVMRMFFPQYLRPRWRGKGGSKQ